MSDDTEGKLPVYACDRSEWSVDDKPCGFAASKREAAKLIRQELGDSDYGASDVFYSPSLNAYFTDE